MKRLQSHATLSMSPDTELNHPLLVIAKYCICTAAWFCWIQVAQLCRFAVKNRVPHWLPYWSDHYRATAWMQRLASAVVQRGRS